MAARKKASSEVTVKVMKVDPKAIMPTKGTDGSACYDLYTIEDYTLRTLNAEPEALKVRTGLAVRIPEGYHMKIFLRSSTGLKTKLRLANGTGIIDSDYRGEVMLLIENVSRFPMTINAGTRIAQCLIEKNVTADFEVVESLEETKRGKGGFGSTGKGEK